MLALLLLWSATATSAPFSHALHLKLKPDCLTCHPAAATSTRVSDYLLPNKSVCQGCHMDVRIGAPPPTALEHFNHQLHLRLGNIAPVIAKAIDSSQYLGPSDDIRRRLNSSNPCLACHRGVETSSAPSRALLPQMADCLVCHSQIDPPESCH